MSGHDDPSDRETRACAGPPDSSGIDEILGAWQDARDRGEAPTPEELVAAHPRFAEELLARFDALRVLDAAIPPPPASEARLRVLDPGRYEGFRVLGQGGMGVVWWALDSHLNREVAVKVVRPADGSGLTPASPSDVVAPSGDTPSTHAFRTLCARFLHEALITAGLEHPGIVPVYEVGRTEGGIPYYTMRFVRGRRTFARAIEDVAVKGFEERLALLEPFLRVCDTIRYAHAHGVIHRDLKPENVALGEFGEVVILDWGLAKVVGRPDGADAPESAWRERMQQFRDGADLRTLGGAMGTPGYMPPEALLGRHADVDERSDVYALGVMLFEILTGRPPVRFSNLRELLDGVVNADAPAASSVEPAVPPGLSAMCAAAMARDRSVRTASADALATELRAWVTQRAQDREADRLLSDARAAMARAATAGDDDLPGHLDTVRALCADVDALRPGDASAAELARAAAGRRSSLVAAQVAAARKRVISRAAWAAGSVCAASAAIAVWQADERRRSAESAAAEIAAERDATKAALGRTARAEAEASGALARATESEAARNAALVRARALGLASASHLAEPSEPALALLLAREAVRLAPGPVTMTRLHASLDAPSVVSSWQAPDAVSAAVRGRSGEVLVAAGGALHAFPPGGDLPRPGGPVSVLAADASGERIVAGGPDGKVHILGDRTSSSWITVTGPAAIVSLTIPPLGDRVAATFRDGSVRMWDMSGAAAASFSAVAAGACTGVSFSPTGRRMVTWGADGVARIRDERGDEEALVQVPWGGVLAAGFSPDGRSVVVCGPGLAVVCSPDGERLAALGGHAGSVLGVAFARTSGAMATASADCTARVWAADGRLLAVLEGHDRAVTGVAFDEPGERLLTVSRDGTARVWDLTGRQIAVLRGGTGPLATAVFCGDGRRVVTVSVAGSVRMFDLESGEVPELRGHRGPLHSVAWLGAGRLVTAGADGAVRIRTPDGAPIASHLERPEPVVAMTASPRGDCVAAVWADGSARLVGADGSVGAALSAGGGGAARVAFSGDGARVFVSFTSGDVHAFSAAGESAGSFRGRGPAPYLIAADRTGARVATAAIADGVRVCGPGSAAEVRLAEGGTTTALGFSPDGACVSFATIDGVVTLAHADTGRAVRSSGAGAPVTAMRWAPHGGWIAAASADGTVRVIGRDGIATASWREREVRLSDVAVSPDGQVIATASADGRVTLWSPDGRELDALPGHGNGVASVAFSADGARLASASLDGTARIRFVRAEDLAERAAMRVQRGFTPEELRRYGDLLALPR